MPLPLIETQPVTLLTELPRLIRRRIILTGTYFRSGVHKSRPPVHLSDWVLWGGAWYLWSFHYATRFMPSLLKSGISRCLLDFLNFCAPLRYASLVSFRSEVVKAQCYWRLLSLWEVTSPGRNIPSFRSYLTPPSSELECSDCTQGEENTRSTYFLNFRKFYNNSWRQRYSL
jgi:hypothetical protein